MGRDVRELSLGERQLAVLAMTIAQGARLLLLDEPTVHLDLRHQVEVMELLVELNEAEGEDTISTGYHAVEFLLWGQDLSATGPGAPTSSRRATGPDGP